MTDSLLIFLESSAMVNESLKNLVTWILIQITDYMLLIQGTTASRFLRPIEQTTEGHGLSRIVTDCHGYLDKMVKGWRYKKEGN